MKNYGKIYGIRKKALSAAALLLAFLLFICGCDVTPGSVTTEQEMTEAEKQTEQVTGESEKDPVRLPDGELEKYSGLVISKVYGNGGNKSSACSHSFIELANTGETPLSLLGVALYYKSGNSEYKPFSLPDVTLDPGKSFLIRGRQAAKYDAASEVIRIDGSDAEWDIALDTKEIRLILASGGEKIDKNTAPEEFDGKISYFAASDSYHFDTGYVSDMSKNKVAIRTALCRDSGYYTLNLTKATTEKLTQTVPKTMNGVCGKVIRSMLAEIKFSSAAGFYEEPFDLSLTAPAGCKEIYYTTDGSDPASSETRKLYKEPIKLDDTTKTAFGETYKTGLDYVGHIASSAPYMIGAHVIKACAYDGKNYTGVYTNSYFISDRMADYGVTVMSVSLETGQMFGNPGFYHNFDAVSNDPNPRGKAFMEVFDQGGVRRGYSNVELSISGHGSSGTGMRSMKVFYKGSENSADGTESKLNYDLFDGYAVNSKGQRITDFSRLLLRNSGNDCGSSYIRDAYMQRVSRDMNVDTMAYAPVLVFINGDFWGIYNARERYSGDYVQSHYGIDKDNVALIESDYSQVHTNQNAPFIVTSGLDDDADDFNELVDFIKSNSMADEKNYEYVCGKLDIDSFIDMYVSRIYFSARDWPENNIKAWRNRADDDPSGFDNKWHFTLLDMDMGISFFTDANNTTENSNFFGWIDSTHCVVGNIMHALRQNDEFLIKFLQRFYRVLNEVYVPSRMEEELDIIVEQREPIANLQTVRWGASRNIYNASVANMRSFVQNRYGYALHYLCSYFGISEDYLISISGNYVSVKFPETRLNVKIDGAAVENGWIKRLDGELTVKVSARAKEGFEIKAIIYTDKDGNVTRYEGNRAEITVSSAGEISFETKRKTTGTELAVHPGIVAGGCQMFYLSPEGKLYAWGGNYNNVLGAGADRETVTEPVFIRGNVAMVEICHSNDMENNNVNVMAALLTLDGDIYVSGASTVPGVSVGGAWTLLEFDGVPVSVSVGFDHLLILDKDGAVWGIGNNSYGQLGAEDEGSSVTAFRKIAENAVMISAGRRNTAYIDQNGDCYVLGDARWNKFNGSTSNITKPYKLLSGVSYITSGEHEMLLVTEDGGLYYAGWRSLDVFTQGGGSHGAKQLSVKGVTKAAIHFSDMVILTESGAMYAYGLNNGGCINGSSVGGVPSMIFKNGVADVAAGYAFAAYLGSDGVIRVNGSNANGEAANDTTSEFESWSEIRIK